MALFSQRKGIRLAQKALQRESIDEDLRNRLWSGLKIVVWDRWSPPDRIMGYQSEDGKQVELIIKLIWLHYFKLPIDTIPAFDRAYPKSAYEIIREHFFEGEWWEVYDFIEFLIKTIPKEWANHLREILNHFLEAENSAYRIINSEIVEITDEHEIEAIDSAINQSIKTCKLHLSRALELLSDRKEPDYRNSIKESISAVESVCQAVTGMPKATLGDCIKMLKKHGTMHPAFEQALLKLYGYTSDEGGIRHALAEENITPSYADAKFMLVTSSAFVNFILMKTSEFGIDVNK